MIWAELPASPPRSPYTLWDNNCHPSPQAIVETNVVIYMKMLCKPWSIIPVSAAVSQVLAYSELQLFLTLIYRFLLFFCDTPHYVPLLPSCVCVCLKSELGRLSFSSMLLSLTVALFPVWLSVAVQTVSFKASPPSLDLTESSNQMPDTPLSHFPKFLLIQIKIVSWLGSHKIILAIEFFLKSIPVGGSPGEL